MPTDVSSMAVAALSQLVLKDVNRLKCWRSGGVDKLRLIADAGAPRVAEVALDSVKVLMAGPRIPPAARYTTASGRRMGADDMRAAIQRLNHKESYLAGVNAGLAMFEASAPGAVSARPATARPAASPVSRADFLPPRPASAGCRPRATTITLIEPPPRPARSA